MRTKTANEKYSLWLMPTGEVYERLAHLVRELSDRHGGPAFEPHVTLLGAIVAPRREVLAASAALAARLRPWMLRLEEIDYLDEYFRSLFVRVAPSRPLLQAYAAAVKIFCYRDRRPFMPHLSLLYGDFSRRLKEAAKSEWGPRFDLTFKARSLHVYCTRGEPERWRRIARYGLN